MEIVARLDPHDTTCKRQCLCNLLLIEEQRTWKLVCFFSHAGRSSQKEPGVFVGEKEERM